MSWAKVDDGWWCHSKVMGLTLGARGLWVSALSWSCAQRQPVIPPMFLRLCGADEAHATELVDAGLWLLVDAGWEIHDWSEYQEKSLSEKRAEAGRKGGEAKAKRASDQPQRKQTPSKTVLPEVANGLAGTHPYPSLPDPSITSSKSQDYSQPEPVQVSEPLRQAEVDEQTVRRTAVLVGRTQADRAAPDNPAAYAAGITKSILNGDPLDRSRIERLLGEGQTPEAIAEAWSGPEGHDWLNPDTRSTDPGPDLKALYEAQTAATAKQLADQHRDPPEVTADARAAARAALRGPKLQVVQ